jgi:hypothetical protein
VLGAVRDDRLPGLLVGFLREVEVARDRAQVAAVDEQLEGGLDRGGFAP